VRNKALAGSYSLQFESSNHHTDRIEIWERSGHRIQWRILPIYVCNYSLYNVTITYCIY
jgi:hypothetical protein